MSAKNEVAFAPLRQAPILALVLLVTLWAVFRIGITSSGAGDTAALSANDRSRWSTVAALVHHGTYVIDEVIIQTDPRTGTRARDKAWYTIDLVRHKGHDGKEHYYSSKPTLLPTLLAGEYWLLHKLTGWDIRDNPVLVIRSLLLLTNLPLFLFLVLICISWSRRYCSTGWARVFAAAVITWGTFLLTFSNTLNNHLVAAVSVGLAMEAYLRFRTSPARHLCLACVGGMAAAFAAANELPALAFLFVLGFLFGIRSWRLLLLSYIPAAAVVGAAFFGTNWLAHGTIVPAYAHRSDGPQVAVVDATDKVLSEGEVPDEWRNQIAVDLSDATLLLPHEAPGRWMLWDRSGHDRLALVRDGDRLSVREWGNWYDYPGSYWIGSRRGGFDVGEPSRLRYAFHMLVGHHGIFSLTPVWGWFFTTSQTVSCRAVLNSTSFSSAFL
ncbi:MAG TPA: hypothetical protein EYN70_15010, partial [Planctomycetaceae bacterium]|nr:hypothetical protein [Planctomycetaceae bacterium]